jgi:hypothetical protein
MSLVTLSAPWPEGEQVRFDEVYQGVLQAGGIAYGFVSSDNVIHANPPPDTLVPSQARLLIAKPRHPQPAAPEPSAADSQAPPPA